jgi:predicted secreted protein
MLSLLYERPNTAPLAFVDANFRDMRQRRAGDKAIETATLQQPSRMFCTCLRMREQTRTQAAALPKMRTADATCSKNPTIWRIARALYV